MSLELKLLLIAYGVFFVIVTIVGEIVLHAVKEHFGGGREGRQQRRRFSWTCRQVAACVYFFSSINGLRDLPIGLSAEFGTVIIALQAGAVVIGALLAWWAVHQWQIAWAN